MGLILVIFFTGVLFLYFIRDWYPFAIICSSACFYLEYKLYLANSKLLTPTESTIISYIVALFLVGVLYFTGLWVGLIWQEYKRVQRKKQRIEALRR